VNCSRWEGGSLAFVLCCMYVQWEGSDDSQYGEAEEKEKKAETQQTIESVLGVSKSPESRESLS